jgi:type I restriction enzyme, S subunit
VSLPEGWARCRLEDLLAFERGALADGPFGSALKSEHYTDHGCRVIRLNNIGRGQFNDIDRAYIDLQRFEALRRHEARAGDLVTAALGEPLGRTCVVPEGLGPAIVKADCFRTRLASSVDSDLVRYWLNSPALATYFSERGKGVGRVRINTRVLREAPLPLPPRATQRAIATRLGRIEDRAQLAKAEARKAAKASELLRSAGLRAGVTGDLTARWRAGASNSESIGATLARTPVPRQDRGGRAPTENAIAGIGAIAVNDPGTLLPDGWRWTPLLRVASQGTGHTPSRNRPEYWDGDVPWLSIPDARDHHGRWIKDTVRKTTKAGLDGSSARLLPAGTVCLSRTASVGYVTILGRPMATSQDFVTWSCTEALLPEFLMLALMAEGRGIRRFGRGSTHTTIYMPELRAFHIALPPPGEQQEIVAQVSRILTRADLMREAADTAASTADRLLPKAVAHAMAGGMTTGPRVGPSAVEELEELRRERARHISAARTQAATRPKQMDPENMKQQPALPEMVNDDLVGIIASGGGTMRAAELWVRSGLEIDAFYRTLRDAVDAGWISETEDKEVLRAD